MERLFGTDGIRGEAGRFPVDAATAFAVGQAITVCLRRPGVKPRVVVGRDTRLSGPMIEGALESGIVSMGGEPQLVGVLPTPGVAYVTASTGADAGVVISASHNPYQDNGLKVFSRAGTKLSEAEERRIEDLISAGRLGESAPAAGDIGQAASVDDAVERYVAFVCATLPSDVALGGLKVVLDTANGATFRVAPTVFGQLGAHITVINDKPDGVNINEACGSQHTAGLSRMVVESGADVGLAFDGDGDRLIAVDEKGQEMSGDQVLIACAKMLKDEGRLENDLVVSTVMSNLGFGVACKRYGLKNYAADVGDRNVFEAMQRLGSVLGGEASGHTIFLQHHSTGDGVLTGVQLVAALARSGGSMSDLAGLMDIFPQTLINVAVPSKPPLESVPQVVAAIAEVEAELKDEGRVLVRYSGTEPKCRVMVEAPSVEVAERHAQSLAEVVRTAIS